MDTDFVCCEIKVAVWNVSIPVLVDLARESGMIYHDCTTFLFSPWRHSGTLETMTYKK